MKIFLNEKVIELRDSKPLEEHLDEIVLEYKSSKQLKTAFKAFKQNQGQKKLLIWSDKAIIILQQDFFKLFKRIDAAGGMVNNERGEKLFIFRFGKWDLPKGKMKRSETPTQAAIREVKEETGLMELSITGSLPSTYHIYTQKQKQILKETHWFSMHTVSSQALVPQIEEDISIVRWFASNEIEIIVDNTYPSIKDLLLV